MSTTQSKDLFKSHWLIWQISGIIPPKRFRIPYHIWSFAFIVGLSLLYPIHLIAGLFRPQPAAEIFKNLSVNFSVLSCTFKFFALWYQLGNIRRIEVLLDILEKRIQTVEEEKYFMSIIKKCKIILLLFGFLYVCAAISSELSTLIDRQRRLLYPAWIPIDWEASSLNYWIVNMYQFIGISLQINYNYANDSYPPVCLALLNGHVRVLALRLANLGTDLRKSKRENNKDLAECIKDHQHVIELYYCMQKVLSKGMFFQIFMTAINLCFMITYVVFYADNFFYQSYCSVYIICLALEIFPCCYYGSTFEMEFQELSYAIFSCNWVEQDVKFRKAIIILSQRGLQPTTFLCMGLFKIHLDSFFFTIRSAYSLFAVMLQSK